MYQTVEQIDIEDIYDRLCVCFRWILNKYFVFVFDGFLQIHFGFLQIKTRLCVIKNCVIIRAMS